ncbi:MAG: hypothetical protein NT099_01900 [Candidatus Saganbacteria bacterium]|nr:hypothetical protein [Candidatus Saganbacteria bacterium]
MKSKLFVSLLVSALFVAFFAAVAFGALVQNPILQGSAIQKGTAGSIVTPITFKITIKANPTKTISATWGKSFIHAVNPSGVEFALADYDVDNSQPIPVPVQLVPGKDVTYTWTFGLKPANQLTYAIKILNPYGNNVTKKWKQVAAPTSFVLNGNPQTVLVTLIPLL